MRKDGYRVKNANPMYTVMPYILTKRYDSMNMIEVTVPIAPIQNYLNEKRKQGYSLSHMGVLIAAYIRTAAEYPQLNRFIVNKRIYQRNEFTVAMVVLKPGESDGTMNKMYFFHGGRHLPRARDHRRVCFHQPAAGRRKRHGRPHHDAVKNPGPVQCGRRFV